MKILQGSSCETQWKATRSYLCFGNAILPWRPNRGFDMAWICAKAPTARRKRGSHLTDVEVANERVWGKISAEKCSHTLPEQTSEINQTGASLHSAMCSTVMPNIHDSRSHDRLLDMCTRGECRGVMAALASFPMINWCYSTSWKEPKGRGWRGAQKPIRDWCVRGCVQKGEPCWTSANHVEGTVKMSNRDTSWNEDMRYGAVNEWVSFQQKLKHKWIIISKRKKANANNYFTAFI